MIWVGWLPLPAAWFIKDIFAAIGVAVVLVAIFLLAVVWAGVRGYQRGSW